MSVGKNIFLFSHQSLQKCSIGDGQVADNTLLYASRIIKLNNKYL